ncbi:MAG: outer membrane beta-barrel protein [Tannerella sp.]|jgi:hypothetical protein|nr:outer membrane beta-barrel protein [Tannerella sp.]
MRQLLIYIILYAGTACSCTVTNAQEQERHEISVYAASGLSTLRYDLGGGIRDNRFGGGLGLSYGFFFNDYWGITAGGEISCYHAKARMQPFSGGDYVQDKNITYNYDVVNYHENQELAMVSIPIMLQYQAPLLLEDHFCYAAIGAKIGFPWRLKYKTSGATYTTTGINHNDNSIIDSPESDGFGIFPEKRNEHHIDDKTSYMLSAELGMKWALSSFFFLYTGIYCDYGLNDIVRANSNKSFVSYNQHSPSTIYHHSMLESSYGQEGDRSGFTNKVTPIAAGLKIKFTFMPPGKCY